MYIKTNDIVLRFTVTAILLFGGWQAAAHAQSDVLIDLAQETQPEVRIAVTRFIPMEGARDAAGIGEEAREILENDLKLFELFKPVSRDGYSALEPGEDGAFSLDYPAWNELGIQWLVQTHYQVSDEEK
ncbi:MAG: hypothetical protein ACE5ER_12275, partial [Nitrospinaceae bacterium]